MRKSITRDGLLLIMGVLIPLAHSHALPPVEIILKEVKRNVQIRMPHTYTCRLASTVTSLILDKMKEKGLVGKRMPQITVCFQKPNRIDFKITPGIEGLKQTLTDFLFIWDFTGINIFKELEYYDLKLEGVQKLSGHEYYLIRGRSPLPGRDKILLYIDPSLGVFSKGILFKANGKTYTISVTYTSIGNYLLPGVITVGVNIKDKKIKNKNKVYFYLTDYRINPPTQ